MTEALKDWGVILCYCLFVSVHRAVKNKNRLNEGFPVEDVNNTPATPLNNAHPGGFSYTVR